MVLAERPGLLARSCREIGEIEYSYVESLKEFCQDFSYRHPDSSVETSVEALNSWYLALDRDLAAAIAVLVGVRDWESADRALPISISTDLRRSPLFSWTSTARRSLIFYGKVSVYLRSLDKPLPPRWQEWIG